MIREADLTDWDRLWPIFEEVVSSGDTYAYPIDTTPQEARAIWLEKPKKTYLVEINGDVLGTYYLKTNHDGPGNHVCNCGYMVTSRARGMGLATQMCRHSLDVARQLGYRAMQFNFVAASNEGAVRLWQTLGFEIVGVLPKAFNHPQRGFVDAFIMYQWLENSPR